MGYFKKTYSYQIIQIFHSFTLSRNFFFLFQGLLTHATNNLQRRKLKGKKENEKKEKKESKIQKQNLSFFHDIFSVADYCTFGLGLVLAIKAAYNGQGRYLIMVCFKMIHINSILSMFYHCLVIYFTPGNSAG